MPLAWEAHMWILRLLIGSKDYSLVNNWGSGAIVQTKIASAFFLRKILHGAQGVFEKTFSSGSKVRAAKKWGKNIPHSLMLSYEYYYSPFPHFIVHLQMVPKVPQALVQAELDSAVYALKCVANAPTSPFVRGISCMSASWWQKKDKFWSDVL